MEVILMDKNKNILIMIICLFGGIIIGFLLAPIKQGIGNNCGNQHYYNKNPKNTEDNDANSN